MAGKNELKTLSGEYFPSLPIEGFPEQVQGFIKDCSSVYGTHQDFWAGAFIAATSAALGQSAVLYTKYENPPMFWLGIVAPSGVGKTQPLSLLFEPILKEDKKELVKFNKELEVYEEQLKAWKAAKDKAISKPEKPKLKQSIMIDSTPEAIAIALDANEKGVTIYRDELAGWIQDFGRYTKSGEQQNMLSAWSQSTFKVNRVNRPPIQIDKPFINVIGGIQPGILPELAKESRAINGFLQRFCFVFPEDVKAPDYTRNKLSIDTRNGIKDYLMKLYSINNHRGIIELTPEAENVYEVFYNKNKAINNSGQNNYINEVNSKLDIIVLRIALLLHLSYMAYEPDQYYIGEATMINAVKVCEYFRETALKVHRIIENEDRPDKATMILQLNRQGLTQTAIADVLGIYQSYVSKVLNKVR
jgi:hypothetical protein